jgi:hypothetical protein
MYTPGVEKLATIGASPDSGEGYQARRADVDRSACHDGSVRDK